MTAFDTSDDAPRAPQAGTGRSIPASAIRWQAAFYRTYLADALDRLASDPNPDVQRIGQEMNRCLSCPSTERCTDCPFNRGTQNAVRGFSTR
jgi:hypothetical protein